MYDQDRDQDQQTIQVSTRFCYDIIIHEHVISITDTQRLCMQVASSGVGGVVEWAPFVAFPSTLIAFGQLASRWAEPFSIMYIFLVFIIIIIGVSFLIFFFYFSGGRRRWRRCWWAGGWRRRRQVLVVGGELIYFFFYIFGGRFEPVRWFEPVGWFRFDPVGWFRFDPV